MRIKVKEHFLEISWKTGDEDVEIESNYGRYTLDEIKEAATALQFLIDAMEADESVEPDEERIYYKPDITDPSYTLGGYAMSHKDINR